MRIPQVRSRLHELGDALRLPELHRLAEELRRRPYQRSRRVIHDKVTPEKVKEIRRLRRTTDMLQDEIAAATNVGNGRVSEVLRGKRK